MRKNIELLFILSVLLCGLAGCVDTGSKTPMPEPFPAESNVSGGKTQTPERANAGDSGVDIDLTVMSSTMVFAEVLNIMQVPDTYVGKTIKMRGEYAAFYDEGTQRDYHAVIIADALACCAQGLDFVWSGEHKYPDDYPEVGAEVEISGVFKSSDEEMMYYYVETDIIHVAQDGGEE